MSTQYPSKNPGHQRKDKNDDRNGKKGDDPKSENKDNNTTGTASAHVGDVATPEDSTTHSRGASIDALVSEVTEQSSQPTHSVEDLVGANPINDVI